MADVTINIRALDLTRGAVDSAMRSLRKLTSEARVAGASSSVGSAFRNLAKDVDRYQKLSTEALRKEVRERRAAINTMTAMEARFRLHLLKSLSDTEKASTRERLRRVTSLKALLNREMNEAARAMRTKEQQERQHTRAVEREEKLRLNVRLKAARDYNRRIEAEDKAAARRREAIARGIRTFGTGAGRAITRMGVTGTFAGSMLGSQASMLGSQVGGMMGGIGGVLSGGIGSLTGIGEKTIQLITKTVSLATKAASAVASLYTNAITGLISIPLAAIPKIGFGAAAMLQGVGNLLSGAMRMVGDVASGAVELVGGALQGLFNTVTQVAGEILKGVANAVGGAMRLVGDALGKIGGLAGAAFGKLLDIGISTFGAMMSKISEFRQAMADVFTQTPAIGQKGFEGLLHSVEDLADRLPLAKKDLAKGLFEIVSTQLTSTPGEAMQVLEGVAKAAVAGGHEANVQDTAKAATAVLSAFNLKAADTERTLSKMFKAAVFGRFAFSDLAEGIQNVSGIAANFETTLDDLLTAYVLASQSMAKQAVPVGIKNLILSLAAPTREAGKAMKAAGIELKSYTAEELRSLEDKRETVAALESQIDKFERLSKKTDNQRNALRDMRKALKGAKTDLADAERAAGRFVGVMEGTRRIMEKGLSPAQLREAIPERRALAAVTAIMSAMDRAQTVTTGIAEEQGQQIETALGIQRQQMATHLHQLQNIWENTWNRVFDFVAPIVAKITGAVSDRLMGLRETFSRVLDPASLSALQESLSGLAEQGVNKVFDAVEHVIRNHKEFQRVAEEVWGVVSTLAKAAWEVMKFAAEELNKIGAGDKIADAFRGAVQGAKDLYSAIQQIADGNMEPILGLIGAIRVAWAKLTDYMRQSMADALQFLQGPLNEFVAQVSELAIKAKNPIDAALYQYSPREYAGMYQYAKPAVAGSLRSGEGVIGAAEGAMGRRFTRGEIGRVEGRLASMAESGEGPGSATATIKMAELIGRAIAKEITAENNLRTTAKLRDFAATDGGVDLKQLTQVLHALEVSSKALEDFGFKTPEEKQKAFSDAFDFSKMTESLRQAQAPRVEAEVKAEAKAREEQAEAIRQRSRMIELMGGAKGPLGSKGRTGVSGRNSGPIAGEPLPPPEEPLLEDIRDSVEDVADNTEGIGLPQIGDDEALFKGKVPKLPPGRAFDAARAALDAARAVEGEVREKKKKVKKPTKREQMEAITPDWWPEGIQYGSGDYSRSEMIRLRKAHTRAQNKTAFQPFGPQGAFGFHEGPGFPTLGAPMRDEDGNIIGFRDFQGPSPKRKRRLDEPQPPKRPPWRTFEGKTPDELAAERAAKEAARAKAREEAAKARSMTPEERVDKTISKIPALGDIFGRAAKDPGRGEDQFLPTGDKAAAAADGVKQQNERLGELATALNTLYDLQREAADGSISFSTEQLKALEAVGVSVKGMLEAIAKNQGRTAEFLLAFKQEVEAKIKAIEEQTRKLEMAKGG